MAAPLPPAVVTTPISGSQINLSWSTPSTEDTNLANRPAKYEVRRDGKLIATLVAVVDANGSLVLATRFADRGTDLTPVGLVAGHNYSYVVKAYDSANNSSVSDPVIGMTDWWPAGYDLPAFRVQRTTYGLAVGGDYVRGSSVVTLPRTALRYQTTDPADATTLTVGTGQALLFTTPLDYNTVKIYWRWPVIKADTWQEVALVRSSYGHPSTPRDGQTVFRALRAEFETDDTGMVLKMPPMVFDQPLPSGNWYYYTVFFRTKTDWVAAMSDACLLPRDYAHREHMWNAVPPYYQWVDDNQRVGNGHLRQFLTVFGFEMDNTRAFVEGVLDLHNLDKTPVPLLKGLGANYGLPYESGIGDIRYRGLVANAPNAQHTRGTAVGLKRVIEAVSKYQTEVTGTQTLMLFPDDSEFKNTTGNWGGLHPDAVAVVAPQVTPNVGSAVRLDGTSGCFITGPTFFLGGVKKLTWEVDVSLDDWTPATIKTLAHQFSSPVKTLEILALTSGVQSLYVSPDGSGVTTYGSTAHGYVDGSRHTLGGVWTADNGTNSTVQHKTDGTNLGSLVTGARQTLGLVAGSGPFEIGRDEVGSTNSHVVGNVYGMRLWADDVLIASPDFTRMVAGQKRVTDAQGNDWDLQGTATVLSSIAALLPWDSVFVARVNKQPPAGRGVMRLYTSKANETREFLVPCGDSRIRNDGDPFIVRTDGLAIDATHTAPDTVPPAPAVGEDGLTYRDATPLRAGIAVGAGVPYGFSVWVQSPEKGVNVQVVLIWIGPSGDPNEVVGVSKGLTKALATTDPWAQIIGQGVAPSRSDFFPEARYLIPALSVFTRTAHTFTNRSAAVDVAGAMLYPLGDQDSQVSVVAPDNYLTLGNPAEKLGLPKSGFEGFVIGSPQRGS